MSHLIDNPDGTTYAKHYSHLEIKGTGFVAFRDISMLIQKYVSGTTALDYGCGAGQSSRLLKSLGLDVTGVDINVGMLKYAKDKDPPGEYKLIKSAELPFSDNTFDLVFMSFVLGDVSSKQEMLKIMREINRVLNVGGTFIVINASSDSCNTDWLSLNCDFEENKNLQSGSVFKVCLKEIDLTKMSYFWSEADFCEVISEAGLSIVHTHKPLGKAEDGYAYTFETVKPPFTIFVAKKLVGLRSSHGDC